MQQGLRGTNPMHETHLLRQEDHPMANRASFQRDYVRLNEIGVNSFHQGALNKASKVFQFGLHNVFNHLCEDESTLREDGRQEPDNRVLILRTRDHHSRPFPQQPRSHVLIHEDAGGDHNSLILHQSPFSFYSGEHSAERDTTVAELSSAPLYEDDAAMTIESQVSNAVSAIFIFNLALSSHLQAIKVNSSMHHFFRIYQLYWSAAQAIEKNHHQAVLTNSSTKTSATTRQFGDADPDQYRLLCAAHNNMAHICFRFFDTVNTRNHLSALRVLLSSIHARAKSNPVERMILSVTYHHHNHADNINHCNNHEHRTSDLLLIDTNFAWNVFVMAHIGDLAPVA